MARYSVLTNIGLSIAHPVAISQKLSKIDPLLLWNTNRKLAPLILLQHSDPPMPSSWESAIDPSPLSEKYRLALSVSTADNWLALARRVGQLSVVDS